jgi:hypothetical protein
LSLSGSLLQILLAKGWTAPALLILKTVVPPEIGSYSIGVFLLITNITSSLSAFAFGEAQQTYNIHPQSGHEYGRLILYFTTIPAALCMPFFFLAGLKMREIKRQKIESGAMTKKSYENLEKQFT